MPPMSGALDARANTEEISRAAELFLPAGQVTELRALDVPDRNYMQTWSGCFDDRSKLAAAAEKLSLDGAKAVYFVPNPVNPALIARAANRARAAKNRALEQSPAAKLGRCRRPSWGARPGAVVYRVAGE
jgi:hypothetical protein